MHLLISGIPGTGKSTFARWLAFEHGYVRCPSGEEPGPTFFDDIVKARETSEDVVIDYGFPLGQLEWVRSLIASSVKPWWFDGDRDAALQAFLARRDHLATIAEWNTQLRQIVEHWKELETTFAGRILNVVSPGPVHMPNEQRWELINGHR
ncbi:MAG: hypothetical protein ACYDHP_08710 [Ferrimicrobium sp.]